jgi:hypothetical protein
MPALVRFRYYKVKQIPNLLPGAKLQTQTQLAVGPGFDESAHTEVTFLGFSENTSFRKYSAVHEVLRNVEARYKGDEIFHLIVRERFNMHYHEKSRYLLAGADKKACREMFRRFKETMIPFVAEDSEIDLNRLKFKNPKIMGGWFGDLKLPDVSSVGLFGPGVGESSEWERFERIGEISTLYIPWEFKGHTHTILITAERAVVIFPSIEITEGDQLAFVDSIQDHLGAFEV